MSDYLYVIVHLPLYTYLFMVGVLAYIQHLPWPTGKHLFESVATLLFLYIPRLLLHIFIPEDKVAARLRTRRKQRGLVIPTADEHKKAAATVVLTDHF